MMDLKLVLLDEPQICTGGLILSKMDSCINASRAPMQRARISASSRVTVFPGRHPRTVNVMPGRFRKMRELNNIYQCELSNLENIRQQNNN